MLLMLLICSRIAILFAEEYPYDLYLDLEKRLHLAWKVDYSGGGVDFELTVLLQPNEWCGVGFSDYGEIYDADLVVTWTDRFNIHHFQVCMQQSSKLFIKILNNVRRILTKFIKVYVLFLNIIKL